MSGPGPVRTVAGAVGAAAARTWPPVLLSVVLVAGWELAVRAGAVPPFVLPAPSQVVRTAVEIGPLLGGHVTTTLTEAALGLACGVVAGLVIALATAAWPGAGRAVLPLLTVTQTVPTVVLAPLLLLWAGFGLAPKVVVVALTVFFPVLVSAASAMRAVAEEHGDMVLGLGGTRSDVLRLVRVPAAVPGALAGLRIAATYAIGAAVVSEYLAGTSGLGVLIQRARKSYDVDQIFVAIAVIAVLTAALFVVVDALCRAATPWQRRPTVPTS